MGDRKPTPPTTGSSADSDVAAFLDQLSRTPAPRTPGGKRARLIFALDGTLVASTMQEGLMRRRTR